MTASAAQLDYRPSYKAAAIASTLVFLLYLVTLSPSTAMWDTSEYIAAAYILAVRALAKAGFVTVRQGKHIRDVGRVTNSHYSPTPSCQRVHNGQNCRDAGLFRKTSGSSSEAPPKDAAG
jgi:hypothetical protein